MSTYFSASRFAFYDDAVHADIPTDARPITRERHIELLELQGQGFNIVADDNGDPVTIEAPPPPPEVRWDLMRGERDALLRASDHTQVPDYPISAELRAAWALYRQQLRDLPATIENIDQVIWPTPPEQ